MESLSHLLKSMPETEWRRKAETKIRLVMDDPLIHKFRQKFPFVDDYTIKINMNKLYQHVTEFKSCSNCPGLERCPNDMTGHYTILSAQSVNEKAFIHEEKVACKKFTGKLIQDAINSRIRTFHVDPSIINQSYSFGDIIKMDLDRSKAVTQINDYVALTIEEGLQTRGLYLSGSFGTGKTFLMGYMLHQLAKVGMTGAIVYMPDFAEDLKGMFQEPYKLKETIDLLKDTDLLVFDDIGAENLNPWLRDHVIGAIVNYRMNRKPTFFTSNYELSGLEKHFSFTNKDGDEEYKGQRIMDRIRPFVDVVNVTGTNKRGK
ncbi:primosomal protein DnaI [Paenibacillus sp. SYP-B3998]|uniref:Primosomal protein DnaI n=1 Tax=Paenibacillus sp. SYP-B3998 TaxID=2678564 RepID=A0A6G4A1Z6_9BACL|nr:primosomal protein DnaI [Paenibacillus sp. SYP-B3998]NEW08493.1 primosomal protein DnaI [Paenibacillus sp. SYP-B3998]